MPSKHAAGGCGCCGPCCSKVWDYIRADGGATQVTINGTQSGLPVTESVTLVEYTLVSGAKVYQCQAQPYAYEQSTSSATSPHWDYTSRIVSGTTYRVYSEAYSLIRVDACLPSPSLHVENRIQYGAQGITGSLDSTLTGMGFVYDNSFGVIPGYYNPISPPASPDVRYFVGNSTAGQVGLQFSGTGPFRLTTRATRYDTITDVNDMLEFFTFPFSLSPLYDPLGYSMDWDIV